MSNFWVCYVAVGKQLAAGPYYDGDTARAAQVDIAGYAGVTTCYVWLAPRPPRGYITLEQAVAS
jgi:hypothetical protein